MRAGIRSGPGVAQARAASSLPLTARRTPARTCLPHSARPFRNHDVEVLRGQRAVFRTRAIEDGPDKVIQSRKAHEAIVEECGEDLEGCSVERNPELAPLKDALLRARRRRDEAQKHREALEAEAQEVAQLAVNAESVLGDARREAEALKLELAEAQKKLEEAATAAAKDKAVPEGEEGDEAVAEPEAPSPEDPAISALQAELAEKEAAAAAAEQAYAEADRIAAAAMEAAEEAVRDEMECIAVFNEVESALAKTIEGLRDLGTTKGRQGEEWDRATQSSRAAAAATAQSAEAAEAERDAAAKKKKAKSSGADATEAVIGADKQGAAGSQAQSSTASTGAPAAAGPSGAATPGLAVPIPPSAPSGPSLAARLARAALIAAAVAAAFVAAERAGAPAALGAAASALGARLGALTAPLRALLARVPLPHVHIHESEKALLEVIWLLLSSVLTVPLVLKVPGGSAVLGFLASGALVGPYALGIIQNVSSVRHIAELGVVFLLFNIGLELSFDRLASMGKMVFGMGSAQVCVTLAAAAGAALALSNGALGGAAAVILGGGLALSTTAVAMQVLADRGETGSRHGRAAFSVLLFQDLAVVVLLMLIPLLTPSPENAAATGLASLLCIAGAVGLAGVKAVACMATITVVGRWVLQPLYRRVADTHNAEIFAAMTLLVVLGTSLITQLAGLSLALGAFLAGLLLAETPFHLQIEADIAPYKGLLMGLFFMTVGMEISISLLFAKIKSVLGLMVLLIGGKVAIMTGVGQLFGLSPVQSLRAGLLLSPGGEFAFVLFGEAVAKGILGAALVQELYLVVALSMALTPFLAAWGARLGRLLEKKDMKAMQPQEKEVGGLSGHVIIAGFGRVGRLIGELLGEELIPFVALDVEATRVAEGRAQDLPVYFGDAGSPAVLHALRAEKAACAVICLDTPGANYRTVWALHKHFPHVKTFVRARDIHNALQLERAGATAVVPETLEPSLQLAAAVLTELDIPEDDVAESIRDFRKSHLSDLQVLAKATGSSLGYGAVGEKSRGASPASSASSSTAGDSPSKPSLP